MRRIRVILLFFYSFFILFSCNNSTDVDSFVPEGNVSIQVFDDSTKLPIPYVSIKLGRDYKTWGATGKNGVAILINVPVGTYKAEFYASNYEKQVESIKVEENDDKAYAIYMKKNAVIDIIPPKIIGKEVAENSQIYILFNEGMNRKSVIKAIKSIEWIFSISDRNFYTSTFEDYWKGDNLLIIEPIKNSNEVGWAVIKFRLMGKIAYDHSGNLLRDGWIYK